MFQPDRRYLPPTKTYDKPLDRFVDVTRIGGVSLAITIGQGRKDREEYTVEEDVTAPFPTRAWFFNRETGEITKERPGTYLVTCSPVGWACDRGACTGFATQGTCKHRDAAMAMYAAGDFDPTPPPVPDQTALDAEAAALGWG